MNIELWLIIDYFQQYTMQMYSIVILQTFFMIYFLIFMSTLSTLLDIINKTNCIIIVSLS